MDVLSKTRRVLDLFIRCTLTYKEEEEARVNMLTALENLIKILVALVQYIRENPNGKHPTEISHIFVHSFGR